VSLREFLAVAPADVAAGEEEGDCLPGVGDVDQRAAVAAGAESVVAGARLLPQNKTGANQYRWLPK